MPFGNVLVPSIGLGLLKAGLTRNGVSAAAHYFAIQFAQLTGLRFYMDIANDAKPSVPVHAWHWSTHVRIASPPGVGSFAPKTEYSHGGISPQECIVPELIVERGGGGTSAAITAVSWRGINSPRSG